MVRVGLGMRDFEDDSKQVLVSGLKPGMHKSKFQFLSMTPGFMEFRKEAVYFQIIIVVMMRTRILE